MKLRKLGFLALMSLVIGLTSCGGKKGESEELGSLTPETTKISGGMGDYFTVVDRSYKITQNFGEKVTVEFERTDAELPTEITDAKEITYWSSSSYHSSSGVMINFTMEFLDAEGNIVGKQEFRNSSELQSLVKLKAGEKGSLEFDLPFGCNDATKFRISSQYETYEESETSSSSTSSDEGSETSVSDSDDDNGESASSSKSSVSSSDVDAMLKSYEEYIDKYIALMKKAKNGDMSALAEYPGLMQKAQDFGEKLEACKGDLTTSQLAKFTKLQTKLLKAAQEM